MSTGRFSKTGESCCASCIASLGSNFHALQKRERPATPMLIADIKRTNKKGDSYEHDLRDVRFITEFFGNSWTSRSAAVLRRWWMAYLNWRLEQAAIAQLAALSDRELKDVGLRRCEV